MQQNSAGIVSEKIRKFKKKVELSKNMTKIDTGFVENFVEKVDCPPDGHCLLHAVISSLDKYLLYRIRNEILNNVGKYVD